MSPEQQALHEYSLHQDNLAWSRIQFLVAVQTAVLAGMYQVRAERPLAIGLTLVGFALTALIFSTVERDQEIRNAAFEKTGLSKVEITPPWFAKLTGRIIVRIVFAMLLFCDAALLWYIIAKKIADAAP